jgi:hypothetical protein
MTTALNDAVVVEASGLVRCCAWCLSAARLAELHRAYRCTDTLCPPCAQRLAEEVA